MNVKILKIKIGIFNFERLEANQFMAYNKFKEKHNTNMIIAVKWNSNIYFINFDLLQFFNKSIDLKKIEPNIKDFRKED